ncbi:MAG: hypothetical protein R6V58_11070 [Planctomycetota bacterium]
MAPPIRFTEADWDRIERDYSAWWAGELDRPLIYMVRTEPGGPAPSRFLPNHPGASPEELCDLFGRVFRRQHFQADGFPFWFINFGAGALAAFLGARLNARPDTVWFEPGEPKPIHEIDPQLDPENPWWRQVVDVTRAAVDYWDGMVAISHTDLGGTLDVLASLRTTEGLLTDLVDAPDEVERVLWRISEIWLECYARLDEIIRAKCRGTVPWARSWSKDRTYMLQCDFVAMISPPMGRRFLIPELTAVCRSLDDPFYHLDGPGALPQLDALLEIDSLKGVQWIPGAGAPAPAEWPDVLRRIREAGKLCQISAEPRQVLDVCEMIGGEGFQFMVGGLPDDEAGAFLKDVARARRH